MKTSKGEKTCGVNNRTMDKEINSCKIDWRPMLAIERLWLWLFYPAIVVSLGDIIPLGKVKVKLYYEPVVDGGWIWLTEIDKIIVAVIYAIRLLWMKIIRQPCLTRRPEDENRLDPHDRWEFFAVVILKEEFRILTKRWPGFSDALDTTVWFWLSLARRPEMWVKDKSFVATYQKLLKERMRTLKAWYLAHGNMSNEIASELNWQDEVEGARILIDVHCDWKWALSRRIPAEKLPAPKTSI